MLATYTRRMRNNNLEIRITLFLQRRALFKFDVTDGQNTHDQIAIDRKMQTSVIKVRSVHSIHS